MAGLIPFNRRRNVLSDSGRDFYDMIDEFFNDGWLTDRSPLRDTFKIDVKDAGEEYVIEAEIPGVSKDEIELSLQEGCLTIAVNREESVVDDGKNYIHRERRTSSMSRGIRLADARPDGIKAKLQDGVLAITVAKMEKQGKSHKINIE